MTAASPPSARLAPALRTALVGDLVALVVAAAFVQLAFLDRVDLSAHVVAGGGVALLTAVVAPRRFGPWVAAIAVASCLVLAVASEQLQPGVLDWGDVAYTGAGALLLARSSSALVGTDRRTKALVLALGAALILIGLVLRYGR